MALRVSMLSARIAQQNQDATAVRHGSRRLSYAGLNDRADRIAKLLGDMGVGDGSTVVVALDRSFEWFASVLGVLRSGAAYVPIDGNAGLERLRFVIEDSGAQVVLAGAAFAERLHGWPQAARVLEISAEMFAALEGVDGGDDGGAPDHEVEPGAAAAETGRSGGEPGAAARADQDADGDAEGNLAYVIYTSGSTGVPKGVEITRENLNNLVAWHLEAFAVTAADVASHVAGLGFDAAAWETWPYLAAGATITLADDAVRSSPELLREWMVREGVTIGFVPTALAEPLISSPWPVGTRLRTLLTGGETLHRHPVDGLPFAVVNNYGPTECTVVATSGVLPAGSKERPSIGRAIAGNSVYVLDDAGSPVADGRTGEIVVGGAGVGRGYRNLAAMTAESFVPDPFAQTPGARMYRSGDRGRRLPDGSLEFLGRLDRQVKVRGQRVELDEIGAVLHRHSGVRFATVVAQAAPDGAGLGETRLLAYVLPRTEHHSSLTAQELQEFLLERLPSYMVPSGFVRLTELPLTENGKVDERLLPLPDAGNGLGSDLPAVREPNSEMEERLLGMVRGLLGSDAITVEDDFFLVGGHSLLGTQLVLRVRDAFGIEMPLRGLFEAPTVEMLACSVEEMMLAELEAMSDEEAQRLSAEPGR